MRCWAWKRGSMRLHLCRGDTLPVWNHTLLGKILLWRSHSLQESGCHKRRAYAIAFLLKCLACVHLRQQCPQRDTAYSQTGSAPAAGTLQWTRASGRMRNTIEGQKRVPATGTLQRTLVSGRMQAQGERDWKSKAVNTVCNTDLCRCRWLLSRGKPEGLSHGMLGKWLRSGWWLT